MAKAKDLSGQQFGKLTVLKRSANRANGRTQWICKCECGNETTVVSKYLINGDTKSCGCYKHTFNQSHGMFRSRPYRIWASMKNRCLSRNNRKFDCYGGRGITVCDKWLTFEGFWEDMQYGYRDGLTLERKDVDGNYEPSNCMWLTLAKQQMNKRTSNLITIDGMTKNISEWAKCSGIPLSTLTNRQKRGIRGSELLSPVRRRTNQHASNS